MTLQAWLEWAREDARRRSLEDAVPIIEALGRAAEALRAARWDTTHDEDPPDPETER